MRIASDGLPFILPPALIAAVAFATQLPYLASASVIVAVAVAAFFRDPDRLVRAAPNAVLSPADGRVVEVQSDVGGVSIAVFLSLLNVHIARSPIAGQLVRCEAKGGGYAAAFSPRARHNARVEMDVTSSTDMVRLSLMAGLVARRVLPWVEAPAPLRQGQRIAIIRFGSRAEIQLPAGFEATVQVGDTVRAGLTTIARRTE